jgi:hypothetical protein
MHVVMTIPYFGLTTEQNKNFHEGKEPKLFTAVNLPKHWLHPLQSVALSASLMPFFQMLKKFKRDK